MSFVQSGICAVINVFCLYYLFVVVFCILVVLETSVGNTIRVVIMFNSRYSFFLFNFRPVRALLSYN